MPDEVQHLRASFDHRAQLIRAFALAYIEQHGQAYSREICDAMLADYEIRRRVIGTSRLGVPLVARELRKLEAEGQLHGWYEQGPRMLRRYYQIRVGVGHG